MQIDKSTASEIRKALFLEGEVSIINGERLLHPSKFLAASRHIHQCARMDFKMVQHKLLCSKSGIIAFIQAKSTFLFENCHIRLFFSLG